MTADDCIIGLYLRVDEIMRDEPKHPQVGLYHSEIVTPGLLFALKGLGQRTLSRWLHANYCAWFPRLPHRTRLFRLFCGTSELG